MYYQKIKIFGIIVFILTSIIIGQDYKDSEKELEKIFMEYQQITYKLLEIQEQALSDPEIKKQSKMFHIKLDSVILLENPSVKTKIEKREKILDNFEEAQQNGDEEKMLKLQHDFESLDKDLEIHQQQALKDKKLRKEMSKLSDLVVKKMSEIDPDVPKMIARLEMLNERIMRGPEEIHMV